MKKLVKVLVVDDELLARQGIKHFFNWEQNGFQIVGEAANGREAFHLIETLKPQIVLTDIVMPVLDGEELVRLIKHRWPEIEVIVLSSFSEFDYVRSTFQNGVSDYILKPHLEAEMLLEALFSAAEKIVPLERDGQWDNLEISMNQVLEKLLSGFEAEAGQEQMKAAFPNRYYCLLGTEVCLPSAEGQREDDGHPVIEPLKALFPAIRIVRLPGRPVKGHPEMSLFLLNLDEEDVLAVPLELKRLLASVTDEGKIGWVLSQSFQSLNQLRPVFESSVLKLLQYRFFLPMDTILMPQELPELVTEQDNFSMRTFTEHIRRLQLLEAFQLLQEYILQKEHAYSEDVFEFKSFIGNMIFNVIHVIGNMNMDIRSLDEMKYSYFKAIDDAKHISEVVQLLRGFEKHVRECVEAAAMSEVTNPSMKLLLDYIEEHYAEPVSLNELAKHFHFNPSYLSSFFASHHHESFKEHLNRIRIDKAADLLRYSDAPISEIGSMVGYGDHSYFCKVFKKSTGLSPSHYRRRYFQPQETRKR